MQDFRVLYLFKLARGLNKIENEEGKKPIHAIKLDNCEILLLLRYPKLDNWEIPFLLRYPKLDNWEIPLIFPLPLRFLIALVTVVWVITQSYLIFI